MAFSVNTNAGALLALQGLSQTNRDLATTQNRISTGLNVASVRDDSSTFIIAQNQRADLAGINAARSSLDRASSTLDVAINAGEAISDLLIQAREIAVAVQDQGLDTASVAALENDFTSIVSQIDSIVGQAEFNGTNLISATPDNVSAITGVNRAGTISRIAVNGADLTTGGATASAAAIDFNGATLTDIAGSQGALAALRNAGDDNGVIVDTNGTLSLDLTLDGDDDTVTFGGGALTFTATAAGTNDAAGDFGAATGNLVAVGLSTTDVASATATTVSLASIDFDNAASRGSAVAVVDNFLASLNTVLSGFGANSQQIELQSQFASDLADSIEVGIGNLVDADLARESASLQALQVQQQLGLAAAGIANQAPGAILSLF